jgi:hypothetical protein
LLAVRKIVARNKAARMEKEQSEIGQQKYVILLNFSQDVDTILLPGLI